MKHVKIMKKLSMIIVLALIGQNSLIALDIPTFYRIDLNTTQLTLENSRALLECLQRSCSVKEQEAIRNKTEQKILELYMDANTTPSKHLSFYMKNMKEIQDFYREQEMKEDRFQPLYEEIENINKDISILREQQKVESQTKQQEGIEKKADFKMEQQK